MKNKRHLHQNGCAESIHRDLASPDAATRAKAARSLCSCRLGWAAFEQHIKTVSKLRKDANSDVRAAALHVFEDAGEMESSGLPTHRREGTNEMLRLKRASRFRKDEEDLAAKRGAKGTRRGRRSR